ncbi:MAG: hypothetical protein HC828_14910 [Blastochloris sp.]|nr:hypothetical protein [Blastochloris sp.]
MHRSSMAHRTLSAGFLLLLALSTICIAFARRTTAQGATFYVATNGNNAGSGSTSAPWATIAHAVENVPDGSTILVRPGEYTGNIRLDASFTKGVTVRAETPYQARLRHNDQVVTIYEGQGITLEGFDIAHSGAGAGVYKTMPRRNVLLVCQELARASAQAGKPIFFDVVWNGSMFEFRTYIDRRGADHRATSVSPVVLSPEFGTLADAARSFDHREEITVVYCAGQNTGVDRVIVSVSDDPRRLASPFNRREMFVDARYLALESQLATEADGALWRRRPVQQLSGMIQSTPECQYRVHWGWGDLLAAAFDDEILTVRAHSVTVEIADGVERVTAQLRADSTEADSAVRRIEGQLDTAAVAELPVFTATPTAAPRRWPGLTDAWCWAGCRTRWRLIVI